MWRVCGLYLLISTFHPFASLLFLSIGLQIQVAVLLPWDMGMSIHPRALGKCVQLCVCVYQILSVIQWHPFSCNTDRQHIISRTHQSNGYDHHHSIMAASFAQTNKAHFLPDVYFVIYEMWNCIDMLSNCSEFFFKKLNVLKTSWIKHVEKGPEEHMSVLWKPRLNLITHMLQQTLCYHGYSMTAVPNRCEVQFTSL